MRKPLAGPWGLRATRVARALAAAAGLILAFAGSEPALSQGGDCDRLRQAIADASRNSQGAQFQAAADRQRAEIDRTVSYANSIGCQNKKFLIFGSEPPPHCGQINAQISRMRANLDDLQARAGGGQGGRGELIARYNAQCENQPKSGNILDALFGQPKPNDTLNEPLTPDGQLPTEKPVAPLGEARAGSKAVCVRACDGAFFPVSYSASGGRLDSLQDMCRALCPNADVSLYTYPGNGEIEQAVSITGAKYMDSPTALKFRQSYDPSCTCRRKGQNWAEVLANAESKLGHESKTDIIVTPEKSAELSRPKLDAKTDAKADAKADPKTDPKKAAKPVVKPAPGTDVNGVDTNLSQQAAGISREGSGILGGEAKSGAVVEQGRGDTIEVTGPDGVKKRVRVVGPTL